MKEAVTQWRSPFSSDFQTRKLWSTWDRKHVHLLEKFSLTQVFGVHLELHYITTSLKSTLCILRSEWEGLKVVKYGKCHGELGLALTIRPNVSPCVCLLRLGCWSRAHREPPNTASSGAKVAFPLGDKQPLQHTAAQDKHRSLFLSVL